MHECDCCDGKLLVAIADMPNPSSQAIKARCKRLNARFDEIRTQLTACDAETTKIGFLDKLGRKIAKLTTTVRDTKNQQDQIDRRQELQAEADQLRQTISDLDAIISDLPRTESRLNRLIRDAKVKPDLGRKALVFEQFLGTLAIALTTSNTSKHNRKRKADKIMFSQTFYFLILMVSVCVSIFKG